MGSGTKINNLTGVALCIEGTEDSEGRIKKIHVINHKDRARATRTKRFDVVATIHYDYDGDYVTATVADGKDKTGPDNDRTVLDKIITAIDEAGGSITGSLHDLRNAAHVKLTSIKPALDLGIAEGSIKCAPAPTGKATTYSTPS